MPKNKSTLILVGSFLAVSLGVLGYFVVMKNFQDPERNVSKAAELAGSGDYRAAAKMAGRAVAKRPTNLRYLDLWDNYTRQVVPATADEAHELYQETLKIQRQRTRAAQDDPAHWTRLLQMFEENANFVGIPAAWESVGASAKEMSEALLSDSPGQLTAKLYAGIANANREILLSDEERAKTEKDLRDVIAVQPTNTKAWDALMMAQLGDADRLLNSNQQTKGQERMKAFEATLAEAEKAIPGSFAVAIAKARQIRSRASRYEIDPEKAADEMAPILAQLAAAAEKPDADGQTVLETTKQMIGSREPKDVARAVAILDAWLAKHPDDVMHQRVLALALSRGPDNGGDLDRAIAVSRAMIDAPMKPVSLAGVYRDDIRAEAASRIFDIEYSLWQTSKEEEKAKHLEAAKAMRALVAEIAKNRLDDIRLLRFDGKLAMAAGDVTTASTKFEKIIQTAQITDPDIYLLAADAWARRNELGRALNFISRGVDAYPQNLGLMLAKARVEFDLRKMEDCIRTTSRVLALAPGEPTATDLLTRAKTVNEQMSAAPPTDLVTTAIQASAQALFKKDVAGAREALAPALAKTPDDVRLLGEAARVELVANNNAKAIEYLDKALGLAPQLMYLRQLKAIAMTADPIKRVELMVDSNPGTEAERDVTRYAVYSGLLDALKEQLARGGRASDGRQGNVEELKKTISLLEADLPRVRDKALAAAPNDATVLGTVFAEATAKGDWAKAEEVAAIAEKNGNVPLAVYLRGRSLALQGKNQASADYLEDAHRKDVRSADIARQLGQAREALGQVEAALIAYREAYDARPNDLYIMKLYSDLLQRSGDAQKALELYRNTARMSGGDPKVVNAWLTIEWQIGERAEALCRRRQLYLNNPSDRDNTLRLATMLTEGQADPHLIVDADCKAKYPDATWAGFPPQRKQTELQAMIKANIAEGNDIFRRLLLEKPDDFEAGILQARSMRRNGKVEDGEKLLRAIILNADQTKIGVMWFGLGEYLADAGRSADADKCFAEAQKLQDPKTRDADLLIAEYWFDKLQWQKAYDVLKPVVETNKDTRLVRRLAELAVKLRHFDEAAALLDQSLQDSPQKADAVVEVLRANIATGRAEDLWARGQQEKNDQLRKDAIRQYEASDVALKRAAELQPGSPLPYLAMAANLRERYLRTREAPVMAQALAMAEKGCEMSGAYWPAARLRADIISDKGDNDSLKAAIQVLEKFVKMVPENSEARKQLAEYYLRDKNPDRAIGVVNDGIALAPNDPTWFLALGEVHRRRGKWADAIDAYDKAFDLAPSSTTLHRAVEMRTMVSPPDWKGIVAKVRQNPNDLKTSAYLRSVLGAALIQTGERETGTQTLREAYQYIRDEIAAQRLHMVDWDPWFTALRFAYPVDRTTNADALVQDITGGKLGPADMLWLGKLWTETGPDGLSKAQAYLDDGMKVFDAQDDLYKARILVARGNIAYLKNDCDGAIDAFTKSLDFDAKNTLAMNNVAYLLAKCRKDYAKGLELARKAVAAAPAQPEFLDTLGLLLLRNNQLEEAQSVLERSIRILPSAAAYLHLAETLKEMGKPSDAKFNLQRATEQKPDAETSQAIQELRSTLP